MKACCSQVNRYIIKVKRPGKSPRTFKAKAYVHDWLIRLEKPRSFANYLKRSAGNVKIYIADSSSSSYLFTISTTGITNALRGIF